MRESLIILWSAPLYVAFILLEMLLSNTYHKPAYTWLNTLENIYLSAANAGLDMLMRGFNLWCFAQLYDMGWHMQLSSIPYWASLFMALDFCFYWLHVLDHRCRLFWAVHVTHHSSEEFNLTVGFRSSVFQPMYRFVFFLPLALTGFKPEDILFAYSVSQIYGILLHTKRKFNLGWLEWVLVTPSHHRVHHGSNPEYLDRNMGMLLIIWDRLFGTFQKEIAPVRYGITTQLPNHRPSTVLFHEWKKLMVDLNKSHGFRNRLKVVFGPPKSFNSN